MDANRLKQNQGFGIVEIIVAMAIFVTIAATSVSIVLQSFSINRLGLEETAANMYAQEGIEAVRSIKNQSWNNLDIGSAVCGATSTKGLSTSGSAWSFSGTSEILDSKYTRTITIGNVCRDGSGNISASGTTYDPDIKKITSTLAWPFTAGRANDVVLVSYLSNFTKPIVGDGTIMMAYSKTTNIPYYRIWNGSSWSTEAAAQTVGGNINYVVLKSSRTRNEAILGTLDSSGNIYIQVWNGSSWSILTSINIGAANATTRSFDIEYEKSGDRAVITYLPTSSSVDFAYQTWDGSALSGATTVTTPPTTGVIKWIELTQNPISTSNEIAMITIDANIDVYAMAWNGSSWGTMGTTSIWDTTASIATEKVIDVAYEQTSGRAVFIWGDSVATDQYYRIWNGSILTGATLLDIPASGGVANWIELVSMPNSNELMYGVLDGGSDLNTRKWSGSAWDSATQHPEHTAGAENNSSMVFDIVWETHTANPGKAWLLMGNSNVVQKKQWSGSVWGSASTLTGSDDTSFIRLRADPASGVIFAGIYEDSTSATDDIWESRLTGGGTTWSAENTIWGGATSASPVFFRVDISTP